MRKKNEYSRIVQNVENWESGSKGAKIQLFHHAVENGITSFYCSSSKSNQSFGDAFSESGLSRDKIQIIGKIQDDTLTRDEYVQKVEKLLLDFRIDYLDLLVHPAKSEEILRALEQPSSRGKIVETAVFETYGAQEPQKVRRPKNVIFESFEITPANLKTFSSGDPASEEVPKMLLLEGNLPKVNQEVVEMAAKYGLDPQQFLQVWLFHHPANYHLIVRGEKAEMDAAAAALKTTMIEQDWKKFPKIL